MRSTLLVAALSAGCGGGAIQPTGDGAVADLAPPSALDLGGGGSGHWYSTCGDSVCSGHRTSSVPLCTTQMAGQACSSLGSDCDPVSPCNQLLECATSDPTHGGMCPISRRRFKTDIRYLDGAARAQLERQLLAIPLATWRYKDAPERQRLGFILEDVEPSPGVDGARDQVDLYGYTSMAVAALQVQAHEIAALKREIARLRRQRK
jgi:hypothetical protein